MCAILMTSFTNTKWDWGPVASWDHGANWPIGDWNPHGKPAPPGPPPTDVHALVADHNPNAQMVMIETEHPQSCKTPMANIFWLPITDMHALGIVPDAKTGQVCNPTLKPAGSGKLCGSIVVGGQNMTLSQINPHNGNDPCGKCNCPLAFFALAEGFTLPSGPNINTVPGSKVSMSWSPYDGPPAPPPPPPPPTPPPSPQYPRVNFLTW